MRYHIIECGDEGLVPAFMRLRCLAAGSCGQKFPLPISPADLRGNANSVGREERSMRRRLNWAVGSAAIAITLMGAAPAYAARAVLIESATVHSGPGSNYRSIGRVRSGDRVTVNRCASSRRWCHISSPRTRNGWVRSRSLENIRGGRPGGSSGICFFGARGEICLNR